MTTSSQSSAIFRCQRSCFASKETSNTTPINFRVSCLPSVLANRTSSSEKNESLAQSPLFPLLSLAVPHPLAHLQLYRLHHLHPISPLMNLNSRISFLFPKPNTFPFWRLLAEETLKHALLSSIFREVGAYFNLL